MVIYVLFNFSPSYVILYQMAFIQSNAFPTCAPRFNCN